jgi:DNA replication and repair protein RecF
MHVTHLTLDEFRSYYHLDLEVPPAGLRIVGLNASGKTSLLEALVILATTRSPRTNSERETVRWGSGEDYGTAPYARLSADVVTSERTRHLEISLELPEGTTRLARKKFRVDGHGVRAHDMVGVLRAVLFSPEDVQVVTGPPAERRRQMDILISQIDRTYLRALSRYGKVLSQRNGLLRQFSKDRVDPRSRSAVTQISFWDEELISEGSKIVAARLVALDRLAALVAERSHYLIAGSEIGLQYIPRLQIPSWDVDERRDHGALQQRVQSLFINQLEEARPEEFRRGTTVLGPQRDDFALKLDGRPMDAYGSRGQQRLGVIALKLSEADLIMEQTGERPLILLDDVLSELDEVHRSLLLEAISSEQCQILVTSAGEAPLDHPALERLPIMQLKSGSVVERSGGSVPDR